MRIRKKAVLCAMLAAVLSLTAVCLNMTIFASETITETQALHEAVSLYERLTNDSLAVPQELIDEGMSADVVKSVMLGYINLDEAYKNLDDRSIRKQDFISILYKTVISSSESYIISGDEADRILNTCYDNAYIDDENRIPYAFMIKHGIIAGRFGSEPDAFLTNDECWELVQRLYDSFSRTVTIAIGENTVTIGSHVNEALELFGEPNRIDKTEYGFDWYVYNADYEHFAMIGVLSDRICALFTNCSDFDMNGINPGDDMVLAADYMDNRSYRIYYTTDGKIDGILYNPFYRGYDRSAAVKRSRSMILLDVINANRVKNGREIYAEDADLSSKAWLSTVEAPLGREFDDGVITETGFDVFTVYRQLLNEDSSLLMQDTEYITPVGITTVGEISGGMTASILTDTTTEAEAPEAVTVEIPWEDYSLNEVEEVLTPVISGPRTENTYEGGDDIVIELEMQAATKYHIEVFDVESDEYAVNEYVVTDETEITLPHELFTAGRDYRLLISSITPGGEALSGDEVLISYGAAFEDGVEIVAPYNDGILDDDTLEITWRADAYHDFMVELYDSNNELVVSKVVEDEHEAVIRGIENGKYYLYVTALRRGTKVEKARDAVMFTARQPEPVINEIILERDDVYYYVYEDEEMGLLYFYDEELVDVNENGQKVTKKKIIQKQVKATRGYRRLAKHRTTPAYTTGDPTIMQHSFTYDEGIGSAIVGEASRYLGVPYVWGGETPDGFDCSGLVKYVLNTLGISVNRVAEDQFANGISVNRDELQPGDLVFFEQNGYIHHVGIYAGGGMMIHAPHTGDVVKYQSIDTDYYRSEYAGARRVY